MPDESLPKRAQAHPVGIPIGNWWRGGLALLGLASLGSGGVAVFKTRLEAGPVALLAVGLFFILVAAGGRLPNRLKMGENEAAWEGRVEEFTKWVAEDTPAGQTPELVNALTDLAEVAPTAAAAGLYVISSRSSYQHLVTSMLVTAVTEINQQAARVYSQNVSTPLTVRVEGPDELLETRSDAEISDRQGNFLIVEVKHLSRRFDTMWARQLWEQVRRQAARLEPRKPPSKVSALLISNQELTGSAAMAIEARPEDDMIHMFQHVRVRTEGDFPQLMDAIKTIFGLG